jgi:hypothetical protein
MSFGQMLREAKSLGFGSRLRMILVIMAAVISSLTLHHSAMASTHSITEQLSHHERGADCGWECSPPPHSMPACCGMGLCLSGLATAAQSSFASPRLSAKASAIFGMSLRWPLNRIDRPPKGPLSVAV